MGNVMYGCDDCQYYECKDCYENKGAMKKYEEDLKKYNIDIVK